MVKPDCCCVSSVAGQVLLFFPRSDSAVPVKVLKPATVYRAWENNTNLLYQHREKARAQDLCNLPVGHFCEETHSFMEAWSWWIWGWMVNMSADRLFQGLLFPSGLQNASWVDKNVRGTNLRTDLSLRFYRLPGSSPKLNQTEDHVTKPWRLLFDHRSQSQSHPGRLVGYFPGNLIIQSSLSPVSLA